MRERILTDKTRNEEENWKIYANKVSNDLLEDYTPKEILYILLLMRENLINHCEQRIEKNYSIIDAASSENESHLSIINSLQWNATIS